MEHSPPPLPADFGRQSVAAQLDYHQPPVRSSKWAWASLAVAAGTLVLGFGISAAVQFWALPALRRPLMTLSGAWILFGPVLGVTFAGIGLRRNMGLRALALAALLLNLAP